MNAWAYVPNDRKNWIESQKNPKQILLNDNAIFLPLGFFGLTNIFLIRYEKSRKAKDKWKTWNRLVALFACFAALESKKNQHLIISYCSCAIRGYSTCTLNTLIYLPSKFTGSTQINSAFFCSETDFFFMSFVCDAFFYWINHNKFVLKLAKTLSDAHNCMRFSKLAVANTGKCLMNSCQNARAA